MSRCHSFLILTVCASAINIELSSAYTTPFDFPRPSLLEIRKRKYSIDYYSPLQVEVSSKLLLRRRRRSSSYLYASSVSHTKEEETATSKGKSNGNKHVVNGKIVIGDKNPQDIGGVDANVDDWTSGGTFGSFLLKRQKEAKENLRSLGIVDDTSNEGISTDLLGIEESPETLNETSTKSHRHLSSNATSESLSKVQKEISSIPTISREIIRELDDSVTILSSGESDTSGLIDDLQLLPLPKLYSATQRTNRGSDVISSTTLSEEKTVSRSSSSSTPSKASKVFSGRFQRQKQSEETSRLSTEDLSLDTMPSLSKPEHYTDRISRDIRHLAVSIASNINEPWQWKEFYEEKGGVLPLLQCIEDGAQFVKEKTAKSLSMTGSKGSSSRTVDDDILVGLDAEYEESLMAACTACRSLRDIMSLSPEVSAVITDDILRADMSWPASGNRKVLRQQQKRPEGAVISDLVTLLRHANDADQIYDEIYSRRNRRRRMMMIKSTRRAMHKIRRGDAFGLIGGRRHRREARRRCKLYVLQLLLAMAVASDDAVHAFRANPHLTDAVLPCSSYAFTEQTRRWLRYPIELAKKAFSSSRTGSGMNANRRPFIKAAEIGDDLAGKVQGTANQVLAAIGYNRWVPKIPGQKGLRVLCLDGGGSRGYVAVTQLVKLVESMGGIEVCDSFDIIVGTSTGAIIAFLVGLRRESTKLAKERYNELIKKIFVKSALSTPLLLFTTATYDENHFTDVMKNVLGEYSMLDSRADPGVPYVCAVSSKMSSQPTHAALFRNYNYACDEFPDTFVIDPNEARAEMGLTIEEDLNSNVKRKERKPSMPGLRTGEGSRHPGSFRVLQRIALRASTAAPTVFKPVYMGGEIYCDGGIVASNPTAVAIHEARILFPDIPIEMVVSCGTGGFIEEKNNPKFGWDGIIGQIVNSATDAEQIHHILEDVLGQGGSAQLASPTGSLAQTRYFRLNPIIGTPTKFPIDVTDPALLKEMSQITERYLEEPEQQRKLQEIGDILDGKQYSWWRSLFSRTKKNQFQK